MTFLIIDLQKRMYTTDSLDIFERVVYYAWHPYERLDLTDI